MFGINDDTAGCAENDKILKNLKLKVNKLLRINDV